MNNVVVVVPKDYKAEQKDCPVCSYALVDVRDVINMRTYGCCHACDIKYRFPNREKWEKGWRPNN